MDACAGKVGVDWGSWAEDEVVGKGYSSYVLLSGG